MRQTTLCVPMEVKPESCSRLSVLIDELKIAQDKSKDPDTPNFQVLHEKVPTLHFMSMSIFASPDYDPIFIIEANFDGQPGPFWIQLEAALGDGVREMVRCCKRPRDETGDLYDAVTDGGHRRALAAYLEARTQLPSVYFHGNRGLERNVILRERDLFLQLQTEIDGPNRSGPSPYRQTACADGRGASAEPGTLAYRPTTCVEAHGRLRGAMREHFRWLDDPPPERISASDTARDYFYLTRFLVVSLLVLSLPGVMLSPLMPAPLYLMLVAAGAAIVLGLLYAKRASIAGTEVINRVGVSLFDPRRLLLLLAGVAAYAVLAVLVLSPVVFLVHGIRFAIHLLGLGPSSSEAPELWGAFVDAGWAVVLGLLSVVLTLPLLILLVRYNELRDSSQDAPSISERTLRDIERHEDWIAQNHMGSIVLIKSGGLRSAILRAGHYGLGLLLRVQPDARAGYLGSMRTVHFAHWAFLNNGNRLLFFSNFDHSWGSYLDDFIEKAHVGLTLAWGCCVGFPPTRMLLFDGASHGRQFKDWALASRAVSRFWYSAYPDLTVDQIERNHRIADGLRKRTIGEEEARAWMTDL